MKIMARQRLSASAIALAIGLALPGLAQAQGEGPTMANAGMVSGLVARCVNGAEQPAAQVAVGIDGGSLALAHTDEHGEFFLALPPGTYTVIATTSDGTASRQYVPVEAGQALDIGILDIGGGVAGCGPDSEITSPVLPTFTPTATPTPEPSATPTVVPSATPTPEPATDATPEPEPEG